MLSYTIDEHRQIEINLKFLSQDDFRMDTFFDNLEARDRGEGYFDLEKQSKFLWFVSKAVDKILIIDVFTLNRWSKYEKELSSYWKLFETFIIDSNYRKVAFYTLWLKDEHDDNVLKSLCSAKLTIHNLDLIASCWNLFYGKGVKQHHVKVRSCILDCREVFSFFLHYGETYLDNLPRNWENKAAKLNAFLNQHSLNYLFNGKNFNDQLELLDFINTEIKPKEQYLIGEIENAFAVIDSDWEVVKYALKSFIDERRKTNEKEFQTILVEPIVLPKELTNKLYGWTIVELVTKGMLREEGDYQKHCVGGYSSSINKTHRIFSLRKDKLRVTVECTSTGFKWRVVQSKSYRNASVSSLEKESNVVSNLIEILIEWMDDRFTDNYNPDRNKNLLTEIQF